MTDAQPKGRRKLTMGTRILIGVLAGIAVGIFLGDLVGPFDVVGKIYIGLLQMTVLPYVVISLIGKIGGLSMEQAKRLGGRAGLILLALWAISLVAVVVFPLSLPKWESGNFFSASLVEPSKQFDFLSLYLPTNPFHSLAANVVPAAVLFSILVGVALILVERKEVLLKPLDVAAETLGRLSNAVVKFAPWGTFALSAAAAGTLVPEEMTRLAGYIFTYTLAVLLLTFVVIPGFVVAVTPFRFRQLLSGYKRAGLTAFATGKLFAVLPMVIESVRDLLVDQGVEKEEARITADVFVPLAYPFPNAGKVLSLLFIPFAAWFVGRPMEFTEYPALLSIGLLTFFGSPVAAIPFLLDLFELPLDLFPLFLVAGIWCARLGDVLGAMHLSAFTLIASAWNEGWASLRPHRLGIWLGYTAGVGALVVMLNGFLVQRAVADSPPPSSRVDAMELTLELTPIFEHVEGSRKREKRRDGESRLARIRRTKELRVGYRPNHPPFCYPNGNKKLVGLDIDLIQRLAAELDATLHLVPVQVGEAVRAAKEDWCDIGVGAIPSSIEQVEGWHETSRYLELHLAFLVPDHMAKDYRSTETIRALEKPRIGFASDSYFVRANHYKVPRATLVEFASAKAFMKDDGATADAFICAAEIGAVLSMIDPGFSVVVPKGTVARLPVVFAVAPDDPKFESLVSTWIDLKRHDGTIDALYNHWVLGQTRESKPRRWSVIHNVLKWVD